MNLETKTESRELLHDELTEIKQGIYDLFGFHPEARRERIWEIMEYAEFEGWVFEKIGIKTEYEIKGVEVKVNGEITKEPRRIIRFITNRDKDSLITGIESAVEEYFKGPYLEYIKKRGEIKNAVG